MEYLVSCVSYSMPTEARVWRKDDDEEVENVIVDIGKRLKDANATNHVVR